jgi:hypothetical protein
VGPRAGLDDVEKRKFLTLPGLELRPLGRPARNQSLYRLSYPGSYEVEVPSFNDFIIDKYIQHLLKFLYAPPTIRVSKPRNFEFKSISRTCVLIDCTMIINSRSWRPRGLRHKLHSSARTLGRGFESQSRYGYLCAFILCLCCSVCR